MSNTFTQAIEGLAKAHGKDGLKKFPEWTRQPRGADRVEIRDATNAELLSLAEPDFRRNSANRRRHFDDEQSVQVHGQCSAHPT